MKSASPTLLTDFVVYNSDGNVTHEPEPRLRDQLKEAACDGDVDKTRDLLEKIHSFSGWMGDIDVKTHFLVLSNAMLAAAGAGKTETSADCLRAMCEDSELKKYARTHLPGVLAMGKPLGLPLDELICRIRLIALAGREGLLKGENLQELMQARHEGETVLFAASRQGAAKVVSAFMDEALALRRKNALNKVACLELITQGRGDATVTSALCSPPRLLYKDDVPATALSAYVDGLLKALRAGAQTLNQKQFAQILLAPGASGRPAIEQCSETQEAMLRSRLQDALHAKLLKRATVEDILRHLPAAHRKAGMTSAPPAEVEELSGDDAAVA